MTRYENYKNSSVEWIGKIPSHWNECRLKSCCSLKARIGWKGLRSDEFEQDSFAYLVTGQDFEKSEIDWSKCYQINKDRYDEDPYIQIHNGDILITKDGTIGKIAKVNNLDKPACLNSGVFVLKQKDDKFTSDFLYWSLCSPMLKEFNSFTSTGTTILHLYQNVFEEMPMIMPPIQEQRAIANYLNEECGKIDDIITKQQHRIELLQELKQSIITKAVTKGLNPNAKMKDSGVEWIGEIPKHWMTDKVNRQFYSIGSGATPSTSYPHYYIDGTVNWLISGDLNDGFINDTSKKITLEAYHNTPGLTIFNRDSIVIAMYGASVGKVGLLNIESTTNQACCALPPSKKMDPLYTFFVFLTSKKYLVLQSYGGGQPNISQEIIKRHIMPIPPITEQIEIANYLNIECGKVDRMITTERRRIELLQELKQSIITEVVTGKRKVC